MKTPKDCALLAAQHGPSPVAVAAMFGVPESGVRAAYARNAVQLRGMAEQASRTGRKVRGFTGEELSRMAESAAQVARVHRMAPGPDRWKERSRTFPGIAAAMAEQWG